MSLLKMPNINQVALSGRLVQDPEFHLSENGTARLTARLAVNRVYRDRSDEWQEETSYFDIVLWQKAAESFSERLHKGTPVFATGRLQSRTWRDEEDKSHSKIEIQVRNLQILEKGAPEIDASADGTPEREIELQAA
jgi:single-strand DNA-binding protein